MKNGGESVFNRLADLGYGAAVFIASRAVLRVLPTMSVHVGRLGQGTRDEKRQRYESVALLPLEAILFIKYEGIITARQLRIGRNAAQSFYADGGFISETYPAYAAASVAEAAVRHSVDEAYTAIDLVERISGAAPTQDDLKWLEDGVDTWGDGNALWIEQPERFREVTEEWLVGMDEIGCNQLADFYMSRIVPGCPLDEVVEWYEHYRDVHDLKKRRSTPVIKSAGVFEVESEKACRKLYQYALEKPAAYAELCAENPDALVAFYKKAVNHRKSMETTGGSESPSPDPLWMAWMVNVHLPEMKKKYLETKSKQGG